MTKGKIEIKVVQAKELKNKDLPLGKNDPFVMIHYGDLKFETPVLKNAGEQADIHKSFNFQLKDSLDSLRLEVFDKDHVKDDLIGEVTVPLNQVVESHLYENWFEIKDKDKVSGQLHVQLSFTPEGQTTQK